MLKKKNFSLWLIIFIVFLSLLIDLPKNFSLKFKIGSRQIEKKIPSFKIDWHLGLLNFQRDLDVKKGLDLQGGARLVLEANMSEIPLENQEEALESARSVISRRIDLYGVAEPVILTSKSGNKNMIIVEMAGVQEIGEAIDLLGKTAQLDFRELKEEKKASSIAQPVYNSLETFTSFVATGLTGKDLKKANVDFNPQTGEPVVALEFNKEGAEKFSQITQRNIGFPLAIFLDNIPLTAPLVKEQILNGQAIISGQFDLKNAKHLVIQLNAGALPVPLKIVEQKNIGPSLGKEAVDKSFKAGLTGLILVIFFMILNYGFLGFLASIGLIIYGLITLALYKLIPVTLTLPGIAGFLLSMGMAVDSNILIFERLKEEKWQGKPLVTAMELAFGRAWDSIKDANICTLIACFVLFNPFNWSFLNTSGMVRGFALTLALGIFVSLFTGIVVTRTLIRVFYKNNEILN